MRRGSEIAVIIPAFNEERAIGLVLADIPGWVDDVIVVDNGSTDNTAAVARAGGARVVGEKRPGYGSACLVGILALKSPDIVVFIDGDYSDNPAEMALLVDPIIDNEADLVIGSRVRGRCQPGALTPQARLGNQLACYLIRLFWRVAYTDLGPFRALRRATLESLAMADRNYGWTVEMQIKAAVAGTRIGEVPVSYRRRIGKSKISGTLRGVFGAGGKILSTIFLSAFLYYRDPGKIFHRGRLVVFSRYPQAGTAKTRLIPLLGPEGAAELQRRMTAYTILQVRRFIADHPIRVLVAFEGGRTRLMARWLGSDLRYVRQGGGDLGRRLSLAFKRSSWFGKGGTVIIGTDCPGVTASVLAGAFAALRHHDLVLGPAADGGYYLIGLNRPIPGLFTDIPWGTSKVLELTRRRAMEFGLSVGLLEELSDVDQPDDLTAWESAVGNPPGLAEPRISVIIPALNEAEVLTRTLESLREAVNVEVLVVDGGSDDGTVDIARSFGAKIIIVSPGRPGQLNVGAAAAAGDILLFLHADTALPWGFEHHVRLALSGRKTTTGAFRLGIDSPRRGLRIIEWLADFRSRRMAMPYGDQALFLRKDHFEELGRFRDLPIMEDFEFMRRVRRWGTGEITVLPVPVKTSARRWIDQGILRTTVINQRAIIAWYLGVSPERIARWYGPRTEPPSGE